MSDTQTEKRTGAGQSRTDSASAVEEGGGRDAVDQAELSRHLAEIAEKSRRLVADFLARQSAGGGRRRRDRHGQPDGDRRRVFRDDGAADVGPVASGAGADVAVERLYAPVAEHDHPAARRRGRAGRRAGRRGSPLSRSGVERQRAVRLHQAELSADRALDPEHGQGSRGARRAHRAQGRFLYEAIRRRAGAVEFRADQPGGVARHDRKPRRESAERA